MSFHVAETKGTTNVLWNKDFILWPQKLTGTNVVELYRKSFLWSGEKTVMEISPWVGEGAGGSLC